MVKGKNTFFVRSWIPPLARIGVAIARFSDHGIVRVSVVVVSLGIAFWLLYLEVLLPMQQVAEIPGTVTSLDAGPFNDLLRNILERERSRVQTTATDYSQHHALFGIQPSAAP